MSAFVSAPRTTPARTCLVPIASFADDWAHRPTAPIAVGLRLLSEKDLEIATALAARTAIDMFEVASGKPYDHDAYLEVYEARILAESVSRAVCDPNDTTKPHPCFPASEDTIPMALTPEGIKALWREIEQLHVASSVTVPQASAHDLRLLRAHLRAGTIDRLSAGAQVGIRRFLSVVLEALVAKAPEVTVDDLADEDADEAEPEYGITLRESA